MRRRQASGAAVANEAAGDRPINHGGLSAARALPKVSARFRAFGAASVVAGACQIIVGLFDSIGPPIDSRKRRPGQRMTPPPPPPTGREKPPRASAQKSAGLIDCRGRPQLAAAAPANARHASLNHDTDDLVGGSIVGRSIIIMIVGVVIVVGARSSLNQCAPSLWTRFARERDLILFDSIRLFIIDRCECVLFLF